MNSYGRPSVIIRISEKSPLPRHLDSIETLNRKRTKAPLLVCLFIFIFWKGGVSHIRSSFFPLIPLEDVLSK